MAERSIVDLVEDWQTGFFVIVGAAIVGVVSGLLVGRFTDTEAMGFVFGFVGGTTLAFLAYSYLRYGR